MLLKKVLKSLLGKQISDKFKFYLDLFPYRNTVKAFSQEGEDMLISRIIKGKISGFYVDIGAHHPVRYSNTYKFYRLGWKGINIDAMPGSMKAFKFLRSRDVNLEYAIGENEGDADFYVFENPALNTFSYSLAIEYEKKFKLVKKITVQIRRLETVLDIYCQKKEIDFFSIDVEGFELDVLKSNNWNKYKPKLILVEALKFDLLDFRNRELVLFLESKGYSLIAKTFNTCFFTLK